MRRGFIAILGLLAAGTALTTVPEPASAQLLNPFGVLRAITRPLDGMFRGPRMSRRHYYSRRAARNRGPAVVQTQPPAVAGAAVAGAAVAGTAAAAATAGGETQDQSKQAETKPAAPEAQVDKAQVDKAQADKAAPAAEAQVPVPAPDKPAVANVTPPKDSTPSPAEAAKPAPSGQETASKDPAAKDSFAAVSKPVPPAEPAPQATTAPAVAVTPPAAPATTTTAATPEAPATAAPTVATAPQVPPPPVAARAASHQRNAALARSAEPQNTDTPTTATTSPPAQPQRPQNRLGLAGPLAWPTAFEDAIGFTLWPGEYGERLRGHGIGDVMSVAMVSSRDLVARVRGSLAMRSESKDDANTGVVCSIDPAAEQWPASQIEQSLQLNDKQRDVLKQFKTAFSEAAANIKSSCRDEASIAPVERLRAMQGTLWAVHDALQNLRGPLAKFFDTLSDEQRQKFAAPASAQTDPRSMRPAQIAQLCGAPPATGRQARAAEEQLSLNKTQRASLDAFQKKAGEMGQFLMASCLKPVASSPVERIDAAADRLTAVIFAASSVNLALNDFYNQLDEQQKSKFNAALR